MPVGIPSRVEVIGWNENQVADLLREHKLLDCVDCIYQRHIDGRRLLNLKEGEVLYFLEIHDERSRAKFWSVIKKITEKKGGVQNLMRNFEQPVNGRKDSEDNQESEDWGSDEFDSSSDSDNYDLPEEDSVPPGGHQVSLERQETIKNKLMGLITKQPVQPPKVTKNVEELEESYPSPEDIYDVPEEGCGEPDELYETPSDESGGGVVRRAHAPVARQESDEKYIVPSEGLPDSDGEMEYEDLSGKPPTMETEDFPAEDYVVPDVVTSASVPARPPKPSSSSSRKPAPSMPDDPVECIEHMEPDQPVDVNANGIENYEPPQVTRKAKSLDNRKSLVEEQAVENYLAPEVTRKTKSLDNRKPVIEEENYEPPKPPEKNKKPVSPAEEKVAPLPPKPPRQLSQPEIEIQEDYEIPSTTGKPTTVSKETADLSWQENYEIPEKPDGNTEPADTSPPPRPVKSFLPNFFGRRDSAPKATQKSPNKIPKSPKKSSSNASEKAASRSKFMAGNKEVEPQDRQLPAKPQSGSKSPAKPPPNPKSPAKSSTSSGPKPPAKPPAKTSSSPPTPTKQLTPPGSQNISGTSAPDRKPVDGRNSLALPKLPVRAAPAEQVESKTKRPSAVPRAPRQVLPRKPVAKTKDQLLQEQPWFHGSISKTEYSDLLKAARKAVNLPFIVLIYDCLYLRCATFEDRIPKSVASFLYCRHSSWQDGAFLVRNSSRDPGKYILSIFYKSDIRHLNMPCENGQYRLGDSGTVKFPDIIELVEYFTKQEVEFSSGGKTRLTFPCVKGT